MKVNSFTAITPGGAAVSNQVGSSFVNLDLLDLDLDFDGIFDKKNQDKLCKQQSEYENKMFIYEFESEKQQK